MASRDSVIIADFATSRREVCLILVPQTTREYGRQPASMLGRQGGSVGIAGADRPFPQVSTACSSCTRLIACRKRPAIVMFRPVPLNTRASVCVVLIRADGVVSQVPVLPEQLSIRRCRTGKTQHAGHRSGGGIGRHACLRGMWALARGGSSPLQSI